MAKRSNPGRKTGKQRKPARGAKPRVDRKRAPREAGRSARAKGSRPNGQEAIVRTIEAPSTSGQRVLAEAQDGTTWRVDCLGEPVQVGARISYRTLGSPDDRRGAMERLLDSKRDSWVCTLRRSHSAIRLTPFGGVMAPELILADRDSKGARDGTRVVVVPGKGDSGQRGRGHAKRDGRGPARRIPVRVVKILGPPFLPDADHAALVWKHRLVPNFSRRARLEVDAIEEALSARDLQSRLDLRHLPFITIDPASARDHDDAVFAEVRSKPSLRVVRDSGLPSEDSAPVSTLDWDRRLWIAIADVSQFVVPNGWIDAEARRRGNSFYFPDRSIPMLPERLSSDLCSLRAGVDRLVLVAELRIDAAGEVMVALFHEAVIRSRAGLSYEEAASWLSQNGGATTLRGAGMPRDPSPATASDESTDAVVWGDSLRCLGDIAELLSQARFTKGALSLELPEIEIEVDENGVPRDARLRKRNPAHLLIEEAMLAANRAVAKALDVANRPAIHRSHPPPSPQKRTTLAALLERLGIAVPEDVESPGVLAKLLKQLEGEPSEELVHLAVLRSMSQARYEPESKGHYALRFDHYVHFTSPIRRYADLEVHRALKHLIRGEALSRGELADIESSTARLAVWLSGRERVATEVEREATALACCAILSGREGEVFDARVTAATEFGLFVRLDAPAASGLLPVRSLDGFWAYDSETEALIGEASGRRIGQGDTVVVELAEVDVDLARISFCLPSRPARKGKGSRRST